MRKVGIMGGTFNPIHLGHLLMAENARESFALDQVLFIPSGCSYMKDPNSILPGAARYHMCELAVADNPFFAVSDVELMRPGNTYTYETLAALKEQEPDTSFYFIAGADSLADMGQWKCPEKIFQSAVILVAYREGYPEKELERCKKQYVEAYEADIRFLPMQYIAISSTKIRELAAKGNSIRYQVPKAVYRYIKEQQFYSKQE